MITRLRERHRRTWIGLALVLPVLLALAYQARRPAATMDRLPEVLRTEAAP